MAFKISDKAPNFSFAIVENSRSSPDILKYIYDSKDKRLKSVGTTQTILEMNELICNSLEMIAPWYPEGTAPSTIDPTSSSGVYFSPDFPDFLLPREDPRYRGPKQVPPNAITWGVVRQEPGTVSGPIFRGTQEIRPRHREFIAVFSEESKKYIVGEDSSSSFSDDSLYKWINVKGQFFDNLVQYNIWSKSNYEVEKLTLWFEDYMNDFTGMFREAGINNLVFNRRVRDDTMIQMKNGYHVRSVLYYVRTERIKLETNVPIKRVNLNVRKEDLSSLLNGEVDHLIDPSLENLVKKWVNKNQFGGF